MDVVPGDLDDARVVALIRHHVETARAATGPGSDHALDIDGLKAPDVDFWAIWADEQPLAIGALKRLSADHGEVKSMHTRAEARRSGAGSVMLRHIIDAARKQGMARLSLETGSWDYFAPAIAFYRRHGFEECPPFADYVLDPNSIFLTLNLHRS